MNKNELTNDQITDIWEAMPGQPEGWLKQFGYIQFARAIEAEVASRLASKVGNASLEGLTRYEPSDDGMFRNNVSGEYVVFADVKRLLVNAVAPIPPLTAPAPLTDELTKLRAQVEQLQAMLEDRVSRVPNDDQEWAQHDGAIAFHLIERHADNWNDAGNMMESWAQARAKAAPAAPVQTATINSEEFRKLIFAYTEALFGANEREQAATFKALVSHVDAHLAAPVQAEQAPNEDNFPISVSTYGSLEECEKERVRRAAVQADQAQAEPKLLGHITLGGVDWLDEGCAMPIGTALYSAPIAALPAQAEHAEGQKGGAA